ncbi:MAG: hypothetical protein PSY14_07480 [bacterium]|nr:hypothetical protein [bacterium]
MQENWEQQVRNLKVEPAPDALLARITTVVPHLAQVAAQEKQTVGAVLLRFMSDFQYGFGLKLAGFACVAVVGMALGGTGAAENSDLFGSLIFGDIGWESAI